jgi:hypothetical protein
MYIALRKPKESEVAISNQVKESIDQAACHLREALAFASRTEHPITINTLSDLLIRLDSVEQMDQIMQKMSGKNENLPHPFGG